MLDADDLQVRAESARVSSIRFNLLDSRFGRFNVCDDEHDLAVLHPVISHPHGPLFFPLALVLCRDDPNTRKIHPQATTSNADWHPQPHQRFLTHPTHPTCLGRQHQTTQTSALHPTAPCHYLPDIDAQSPIDPIAQG